MKLHGYESTYIVNHEFVLVIDDLNAVTDSLL